MHRLPGPEPQLLQLIYRDDPWKMMICCVLLNQTSRRQVDPVLVELWGRWSTAEALAEADEDDLFDVIEPCGLGHQRAARLIKLSQAAVRGDHPISWPGVGPYAADSYFMFHGRRILRFVSSRDKELLRYQTWWVNGGVDIGMGKGEVPPA